MKESAEEARQFFISIFDCHILFFISIIVDKLTYYEQMKLFFMQSN